MRTCTINRATVLVNSPDPSLAALKIAFKLATFVALLPIKRNSATYKTPKLRVKPNKMKCTKKLAPTTTQPYPPSTFDAIFGFAIASNEL